MPHRSGKVDLLGVEVVVKQILVRICKVQQLKGVVVVFKRIRTHLDAMDNQSRHVLCD